MRRLQFVPEGEVQVQRGTLGLCSPLEHAGEHHSVRDSTYGVHLERKEEKEQGDIWD